MVHALDIHPLDFIRFILQRICKSYISSVFVLGLKAISFAHFAMSSAALRPKPWPMQKMSQMAMAREKPPGGRRWKHTDCTPADWWLTIDCRSRVQAKKKKMQHHFSANISTFFDVDIVVDAVSKRQSPQNPDFPGAERILSFSLSLSSLQLLVSSAKLSQ